MFLRADESGAPSKIGSEDERFSDDVFDEAHFASLGVEELSILAGEVAGSLAVCVCVEIRVLAVCRCLCLLSRLEKWGIAHAEIVVFSRLDYILEDPVLVALLPEGYSVLCEGG